MMIKNYFMPNDQQRAEKILNGGINLSRASEEFKKIKSEQVLKELVKKAEPNSNLKSIVLENMGMIKDQKFLESIALTNQDRHIRMKAIELITNQEVLERCAKNDDYDGSRQAAVAGIRSISFLLSVLNEDDDIHVAQAVIRSIKDESVLKKLEIDYLNFLEKKENLDGQYQMSLIDSESYSKQMQEISSGIPGHYFSERIRGGALYEINDITFLYRIKENKLEDKDVRDTAETRIEQIMELWKQSRQSTS